MSVCAVTGLRLAMRELHELECGRLCFGGTLQGHKRFSLRAAGMCVGSAHASGIIDRCWACAASPGVGRQSQRELAAQHELRAGQWPPSSIPSMRSCCTRSLHQCYIGGSASCSCIDLSAAARCPPAVRREMGEAFVGRTGAVLQTIAAPWFRCLQPSGRWPSLRPAGPCSSKNLQCSAERWRRHRGSSSPWMAVCP